MKSKVLLLMCGVIFCRDLYASEDNNVKDEKKPLVKSELMSITHKYESDEHEPKFVIDNNCLKAIKEYLSIKPGDKHYPVISRAKDYFKANPDELSELCQLAKNSCWWFNKTKTMTHATFFSYDVRFNIVKSDIAEMHSKILTLQSTLSRLGNQIDALQKAEKNQYIKDLESKIQTQQEKLDGQAKTISDLQLKLQEQQDQQSKMMQSFEERLNVLEEKSKTPQVQPVEISANLAQDLQSIHETVGRLERQLGEKVDTGRFDKLRNSYGSFVTIVKALVDQADEGKLNTKIEELNKQKKDK